MLKLTKNTRKYAGFTLVELIVVITILVILGTIAFISLGGYSLSARDSARISDITNITKALEITLLKNGSVIPPDKGDTGIITITASGTTIGYQGYAASTVLSNIKMSEARDPLDKKYYTYLTNANYTKYQVLTLLENSSTLTQNNTNSNFPLLDTAFAGYETRIPSTKGSSLGVLLGNTGTLLNQPVQESYNVSSFTGVDVVNTATGYNAVFSKNDIISGSGGKLVALKISMTATSTTPVRDTSLIGYWDMETVTADGKLADLSANGNGGTLVGTTNIGGKIGNAKSFNGTNAYISIADTTQYVFNSSTSLTVAAWVYTAVVPGVVDIVGHGIPGNSNTAGFSLNTGYFSVNDIVGGGVRANYTFPSSGTWHHLEAVHDRSKNKTFLYIDGVIQSSIDATEGVIDGIGVFTIGFGQERGAYFSGIIDEVRIYNRALSDSEILSLYSTTK